MRTKPDAISSGAVPHAGTKSAALYRLMSWLSPSYPIGAYTYSHGIERAVETGKISNAATTQSWLRDLLEYGGGYSDAVLFCAAYNAAANGDQAAFIEAAELASALSPTSELTLETTAQGDAFMKITIDAWPCSELNLLRKLWPAPIALPIAVGAACAGHAIPIAAGLTCYCHAFAANLVSAAVRTIPLGQTDGQHIMAALEPIIHDAAERAQNEHLSSFGTAALLSDIASMHHETQQTRLFRS